MELNSEAALHRCSCKKMFWKYTADLQENTHDEVWLQYSGFATLFKSHFDMVVFL